MKTTIRGIADFFAVSALITAVLLKIGESSDSMDKPEAAIKVLVTVGLVLGLISLISQRRDHVKRQHQQRLLRQQQRAAAAKPHNVRSIRAV